MSKNFAENIVINEDIKVEHKNIRKQAIEAIDRIKNGNPIVISKNAKLIFKNIAKEANVSPTELHREFRDVMLYVNSLKAPKNESITNHANHVRKCCLDAIERFKSGKTKNVSHNAKISVLGVAKEAEVNDSYIYQFLPDVIEKIIEVQSQFSRYGNKEKHERLLKALDTLLFKKEIITVKKVCRVAGLPETFDMAVRKSYPEAHNKILFEIEKQTQNKHATERKLLLDAFERLETGTQINTKPIINGGYISAKQLMAESGIGEGVIRYNHHDIYQKCLNKIPIKNENVWFFEDCTVKKSQGEAGIQRLNFSNIHFEWLLISAKAYLKAIYPTRSFGTLVSGLDAIKSFSKSLYTLKSECKPDEINRLIVQDVLFKWSHSDWKLTTIKKRTSSLRAYFEWCEESEYLRFGDTKLITDMNYPKQEKAIPKFIPEDIMSKLNHHIDKLPSDIMRFFLVLQEVGMRISECCSLKFDCIFPDNQGDYFIKYYQHKMRKDHTVPISKELVNVIKEQQEMIVCEFGKAPELLFTTPKLKENGANYPRAGMARSKGTLITKLNKLAVDNNISDASGKPYHFSFHQFRHTVATRMINNGVPQHIIQKYLGHETPTMTSTYAHIMDETLKNEFKKFNNTMIDINGKKFNDQDIIDDLTLGTSSDYIDAQWLKKNIAMQTLPNGLCSLPVVQGGCPHANACLTCPNFRTDRTFLPQHKEQLQRTEVVIETCQKNGWVRQLEMNERIKESLVKIITPLEDN